MHIANKSTSNWRPASKHVFILYDPGCPDPLSEAMSFFRFCWSNREELRKHIHKHVNLRWSDKRDYKFLIKDPVSINIDMPLQIENFLRTILEEGLTAYTRNVMYKALFSADANTQEQQLIEDLISINPQNPRVMNYIWSLSNIGARELIIERFNRTKSIQGVALAEMSRDDLVRILENLTENQIRHYIKGVFCDLTKEIFETEGWCAMDTSMRLRTDSWGFNLTGVNMPCITEQWMLVKYPNLPYVWTERSILFDVQKKPPLGYHLSRGPSAPYFGSKTREKTKKPQLMTTQVDPVIDSLKKLMMIKPWVNPMLSIMTIYLS